MKGRLYRPDRLPTLKGILGRIGVLLVLLLGVTLLVYCERGLIDSRTGEAPGFLDSLYFVLVTVTTVGYGDIVPVQTTSRLTDAFLLTPFRLIFIFTFVGTAYELQLKRFQEEYRMKRAVDKLSGHIVICGFGNTGRVAAAELFLQGTPREQVVALDVDGMALAEAAEMGVVAVEGDATHENVLESVAVRRAKYVLICPGRDDTAVLIALTAKDLNPGARLVAMCLEQENAKLLERSGVDTIISRAAVGGNVMAAATRRGHLAETMQDILSVSGALQLDERPVKGDEVGKHPEALTGVAVLRVYRDGRHYDVADLPVLRQGDTLVYVAPASS